MSDDTTEFIPPPPGEPIPLVTGATDAADASVLSDNQSPEPDLSGLEDDVEGEIANVELMLAVAAVVGAPTVKQALTLAASQIRKNWGPPENINKFTIWYYGNRTKASWCYIFLTWVLAHAAATQAAGLAIMGGKHAYVPDIRHETGGNYRDDARDLKPGDFVAMLGYGHIEIVEKILPGEMVQTIGGNTVNGSSDDAVSRKERSRSIINGRFRPNYAKTSAPAPVPAAHDEDCWVY